MIFFCHISDVKVCFQEVDSWFRNTELSFSKSSLFQTDYLANVAFGIQIKHHIIFYFQSLESGLNGLHLVNVREVSLGIVTCQCCGSVQAPEVDCR